MVKGVLYTVFKNVSYHPEEVSLFDHINKFVKPSNPYLAPLSFFFMFPEKSTSPTWMRLRKYRKPSSASAERAGDESGFSATPEPKVAAGLLGRNA